MELKPSFPLGDSTSYPVPPPENIFSRLVTYLLRVSPGLAVPMRLQAPARRTLKCSNYAEQSDTEPAHSDDRQQCKEPRELLQGSTAHRSLRLHA